MKSIKWIYNNSLFLITLFLFVFIPLYPKLPVIGVSHTWVYIRAEDFLVAFAGLVFISLLLTKKVTLKTPLTIPIFLFWLVGAVSTLFAISYIFPNLANVFPNVALFHYFRRIEYLSLFFIGFFAIRSKKQIPTVVFVLAITLIAVFIYGLGQRLWEFPAYLTMNEEFAKGIPLKLSAASRIPSTFAGHYDLAAYLVMLIPIVGSMIFGFKKLYIKIFLLLSALSGLILLFMTASRVSFAVYLVTTTFLLIIQKQKKYIIPVVVVSIMLMSSFQGISQRFASTITEVDLVVDARSGKAVGISKGTDKTGKILIEEKQSTGESLPQGSGFISAPSKQGSSANKISYKRTKIQAGQEITEVTDMEGNFVIKKALAYDVSFTTRFQGQWPRATEAFDRSML
ncbi:hypothetical protein KKG52_00180, partial [Patescibacteria group bacterium]|nr:hypothetical protein [Patescibacteria group bacterium]